MNNDDARERIEYALGSTRDLFFIATETLPHMLLLSAIPSVAARNAGLTRGYDDW